MPIHTKANDPDYENGVYYPSSDGKPMAETDFHFEAITLLVAALKDFFAARSDVYVAGDINWYWEEGNRRACRSPDAMVVFDVEKRLRRSFRSWNEGGAIPQVCFEVASQKTWRANLGEVRDDYEAVGVREYFIFDPTREYLPVPLQGFRLRNGVYQPLRPARDWSLTSRELGLKLLPEGGMLRLVDAKTNERVLTAAERAEVEAQRAEVEAQRAKAAEARADILAAEVARLQELLRQQAQGKNGAH